MESVIFKRLRRWQGATLMALGLSVVALVVAGCGSSDPSSASAPDASDFPSAAGKSLDDVLTSVDQDQDIAVAPTGQVYEVGKNRFGFGIFNVDNTPVENADVAVYAQPMSGGKTEGPFPARWDSLATEKQYEAKSTATDPDAAKGFYVVDNLPLDKTGPWNLVVVMKDGDKLTSARVNTSLLVGKPNSIPQVGQKAPMMHTPTAADVGGDLSKIDTRVPHDDMHQTDLADVLGKKPVVLLFATPALCQSRVCGPVVDIAEQVEHEPSSQGVTFIHQEIYNDNDANKGLRPQVLRYGLRTEPWLFVIDKDGRVSTRIEGAFDVAELQAAVKKVAPNT
jgi:hypothetical protein